ncbi:hypothetical protein HOD96_04075, partial [Candidatus Falkowbacteria bacterium]|nr:hypothetical protein [Candidatus Falkowbacteria bacterium]
HAKVSMLISEQGIIKSFPWLQQTSLKENYTDHHFLYHLFLIPFVKFSDPLVGVKFAQALLSAFFILVFYWFLKKEKIKLPIFWVILLLTNSPFLFRISLVKANALSLIFLFLGLYFIFNKKYLLLFISSYLFVLSYGGWPLLGFFALIYLLAQKIQERINTQTFYKRIIFKLNFLKNYFEKQEKKKIFFACFLGLTTGLIVNPYFPENLYFYLEQTIKIGIINYGDKINVGGEWYAYEFLDLFKDSGIVLIIYFIAIVLFLVSFKKQNLKSGTLFLISLFFLAITFKSRRYVEYFIPFSVLFGAFSLALSLHDKEIRNTFFWFRKKRKRTIAVLSVLILFAGFSEVIFIKDIAKTKNDLANGSNLSLYKGASEFIKNNSSQGAVIFHADWDDFPSLFYHNSHNYYLVGLDPTFMYSYNPDLYNEWASITLGEDNIDLHNKIKNHFKADFVFLDSGHLSFNQNLAINKNFKLVYSDHEAKVYKVR